MTPRRIILNAVTPEELARRVGQYAAQAAKNKPTWNLESAGGVASLHVYGVIGGMWGDVAAADIVPAIRALDVATLEVYINSPGGDVFEGIAIRNAIRQHPAHVVTHVDGLAASAASFIAVAGDEVVMGENAQLMIHDAWTIAIGNADDMRQVGDDLDRVSDNIAAMYATKAGGEATAWRAVMKAEAWYSADEAVAAGLADRAEGTAPAEQPAAFDLSMFAHAGRAAAPAPAALATHREKETLMNRAQLLAALNAGTITQAQYDASIASLDAIEGAPAASQAAPVVAAVAAPGQPVAAEYATGPQNAPTPAPVQTEERPRSRQQLIRDELLPAIENHDIAAFVLAVNNAITDDPTLVANDGGEAFLQPDRIGQVWQATPEGRPVIESLGGVRPLTSNKIEGWKWQEPTPAPEPYAGGLAPIPSDEWVTVPVSETPSRWAKGNRIDRIYADLGSADLIASMFAILDRNYEGVSDKAVFADLIAGASALTGGATSLLNALSKAYLQLRKIGARPTKFWMAEDVFVDFAELKVADLPAWIANSTGYVKLDGSTSLADVFDVDVNFELAAGGFAAYDPRAATVFESPKVKLEAQVIGNGGIDLGWFAYGGTLINDARAIVKTTITEA
ncbi:head maturation protease, ClpP-related [Microbacterium sp. TNHR37B]|uniref:head maturation protease, ClpP-related n=1 Tax=Microbacterium sp. TNHR37B TaxID=1775956 RepID=UPI0007B27732|nr:head maturation protease, ClpP-related [Microbacterium sp. TNHR37B]KZE91184.1 ATP-dependent Clp protease proteolytic subunit [Microbacterium sp. TNHR37B]